MDELRLEATLENMGKVMDFVGARLEGIPQKIQNQVSIVVDEIFSNIARYAYAPGAGDAVIRIAIDGDIALEFEDGGIAYNPLLEDEPDISLPEDEREIGGLGLFMVKNMMDSVEYRREEEKNILAIRKRVDRVL